MKTSLHASGSGDVFSRLSRPIDYTMINVASGKQQGSQWVMKSHITLQYKYKEYIEGGTNLNKVIALFCTDEYNQLNYLLLIDISSAVRVAQSSA